MYWRPTIYWRHEDKRVMFRSKKKSVKIIKNH